VLFCGAISVVCVVVSVTLHLGVLYFLWRVVLPKLHSVTHFALALMVCVAILAHLLEICVFGGGLSVLGDTLPNSARAPDEVTPYFFDSAASYTSLGGRELPTARLRLFSAIEAVTGLVLITWTASFLFLVMQRTWDQ
jgi:hypothetical protein